jgi:hypothetical protein
MRWLFEGLKGFILLSKDFAIGYPWAARGGFSVLVLLTLAVVGLMASNPARFWWAPYVLLVFGFGILFLLFVGVMAVGEEMAGGSGGMGGRTGVMLKDLDAPPPDDSGKKTPPTVRRKGDAVPEWRVKPRAEAVRTLLDFLADTDPAFDIDRLTRRVEDTAVLIREAIEEGDLAVVGVRLTEHGRRELHGVLDGLAAAGARQVYGKVTPTDVRLVLVDAPAEPDRHAVTALVTLESRDYVAEVRTGDVREGSPDEWVVTQEFWSFRRDGEKWKLDCVRSAAEADELLDVLNELSADRYREFQKTAPPAVLEHVTAVNH